MGLLDNLNTILVQLQIHALAIGITLGSLMVSIYTMVIMVSPDTSPMANRNKWDNLHKVILCAVIIAGMGAIMQFAQDIGKML